MLRYFLVFAGLFTSVAMGLPNLSIVHDGVADQPNRAERVRAFELSNRARELNILDEVDADRVFMRELRGRAWQPEISKQKRVVPRTGETIVFFDLNFGPAEIRAAREAAQARGQQLMVFPERSEQLQMDIEAKYKIAFDLEDQVKKCRASGGDCTTLVNELEVANREFQNLVTQIPRMDSSYVKNVAEKLQRQGVRVSNIVFSGHSGGSGGFGGYFGWLSSTELKAAVDQFPAPFTNVTTILLWGCYSGTLESFRTHWKAVFPQTPAFVGYRNRAPLGIRPASGRYLKSYLLSESDFLAAQSLDDAHRIFKSFDLIALLDGTAVLHDYYLAYDQAGTISDLIKRCDTFDANLLTQYECYDQGEAGCENPPADRMGPLRDLYSFLQVNRHCIEIIRQTHSNLPTPEKLIRLIFLDHLKLNFQKHHHAEFQNFDQIAHAIGFKLNFNLASFVHSTRHEDIEMWNELNGEFRRFGVFDLTYLDSPNRRELEILSIANWSLKELFHYGFSGVFECVPFSWVEPAAIEKDSCGLSDMLSVPLTAIGEDRVTGSFSWMKISQWSFQNDAGLERVLGVVGETPGDYLQPYKDALEMFRFYFEQYSNPTPEEARWLANVRARIDYLQRSSELEVIQYMVKKLKERKLFLVSLEAEVQLMPQNNSALWSLQRRISETDDGIIRLEALLPSPLR